METQVKRTVRISEHGRMRLRERIGVKETKMLKLAEKAWRSTELLTPRVYGHHFRAESRYLQGYGGKREVRMLMGKAFVFLIDDNWACLHTVI